MRYTLTDVIVASISQDGSSQGARPIEEISLRYGRIDWSYTEVDPMTSKPKGNVEAYWDLESNTGG
jgi:type VI protein secretion system component Hcp